MVELGVKAFYFELCSLSFRAFTLLSGVVGEGSLVLSSHIDYIYAHTHTCAFSSRCRAHPETHQFVLSSLQTMTLGSTL